MAENENKNKDTAHSPESHIYRLKIHERETAENYLFVLEQLELLTKDYTKYLRKYEDDISADYQKSLNLISINLSTGKYHKDFFRLKKDINSYQLEFAKYLNELSKHRKLKRLHYIAANLQDELANIDELIEDEIDISLENIEELGRIELFLEHKFDRTKIWFDIDSGKSISFFEVIRESSDSLSAVVTLKLFEDGNIVPIIVNVPEISVVTEPLEAPGTSRAPRTARTQEDPIITFKYPDEHGHKDRDKITRVRTISKTSDEISNSILVVIDNPAGIIEVTGWDRPYVSVSAKVETSSSEVSKAEKLSASVDIRIYQSRGQLFVESVIPKLRSSESLISHYSAMVKVPSENNLVCNSSYGKLTISNIEANIKLSAKQSNLSISNISGNIKTKNFKGSIKLMNSEGAIDLTNSYGLVSIYDCKGIMNISNNFSDTKIINSEGEAHISGSGEVEIKQFEGDIDISNSCGKIVVTNVDGNLIAKNSYESVFVRQIDGDVEIENSFGNITANNISGKITASNKFASIMLTDFYGPLTLNNQNGNINLMFYNELNGNSIIIADGGEVSLTFVEIPDMTFSANTFGGEIISFVPLEVTGNENLKTSTHIFGSGGNLFEVKGTKSSIYLTRK